MSEAPPIGNNQKQRGLELLLDGLLPVEVARALDVDHSTVSKWMAEPRFKRAYWDARTERALERKRDHEGLLLVTLETLEEIMANPANKLKDRIAAGKAILETVAPKQKQAYEITALTQEQLEQRLAESNFALVPRSNPPLVGGGVALMGETNSAPQFSENTNGQSDPEPPEPLSVFSSEALGEHRQPFLRVVDGEAVSETGFSEGNDEE